MNRRLAGLLAAAVAGVAPSGTAPSAATEARSASTWTPTPVGPTQAGMLDRMFAAMSPGGGSGRTPRELRYRKNTGRLASGGTCSAIGRRIADEPR